MLVLKCHWNPLARAKVSHPSRVSKVLRVRTGPASLVLGSCNGLGQLGHPPRLRPGVSAAMEAHCGLSIFPGMGCVQQSLLIAYILSLGVNTVSWAIASALKTERVYDVTGTIANLLMLGITLGAGTPDGPPARQVVISVMITVWTLRLGLFLFYRALRWGDSRFHDVLDKPATLFVFYWLQSVWCWVNCLPAIIVNGTGADPAGLQPQDIIGPVLWALGMVLECTADFQKLFFKMDPANKGKFVDVGVWSYARYPNYGGEICIWWGVFIFSTSMLRTWQFVAVASPLFTMLLLFKASGIPLQEKQQKERWGGDAEFQRWRSSTSLLFPVPWKHYVKSDGSSRQQGASNQETLLRDEGRKT